MKADAYEDLSNREKEGPSLAEEELRKQKKSVAEQALKQLKPLDDSNFFVAYPDFIAERDERGARFGWWLLNVEDYFKSAVETY
ncbi:unnamed protein product, partial [Mesorhabditis belari]|uniref:Uncharacterized protein n=1 Tax=Mesorhabditis belari TaxID=2138241 RepID=A0AAF3EVW9_9BILA